MRSLWDFRRGSKAEEAMEAWLNQQRVQGYSVEQLARTAANPYGPPESRRLAEACRRELEWRKPDRDTPFR